MTDAASRIETITWSCLALCTIGVVGRSISKARIIRHVGADDVFIWAGWVCFIGQCVAAQMQVNNGLGRDQSSLSDSMLETEVMYEYVNYLLYMPVIAFAKLSVVSVLRKCALDKKDRLLLYIFEWVLAAWVITSELVRLFPCGLPVPWDYIHHSCINRQAWVVYFEVFNIVTELMLIIMPILSICRIQTSWDKKLLAISFFSARIAIIPASIARIVYWILGSTSGNGTYNLYPYMICIVAVAALEILSACVLYTRPLFEILELGFSACPPTSPSRQSEPRFGPYSKGTWPFTHVTTLDEYLSGRGPSYEARIHATWYDEKTYGRRSNEHIHVSKQVDVRTTYPITARREYMNRAGIPYFNASSHSSISSLEGRSSLSMSDLRSSSVLRV